MYIINNTTGITTRASDGYIVDPAQFENDPERASYLAWIAGGNVPVTPAEYNEMQGNRITKFAFRNRFTVEEKVALEIAMLDQPTSTQEHRNISAILRVFMKDLENAQFVDLTRADIQQGVMFLVTLGIVTAERGAEILNTPIEDHELAN